MAKYIEKANPLSLRICHILTHINMPNVLYFTTYIVSLSFLIEYLTYTSDICMTLITVHWKNATNNLEILIEQLKRISVLFLMNHFINIISKFSIIKIKQ